MSIVTQPDSSRAATSLLPATSSSVLNPWVMLPTLQLAWSSATVVKVRSAAFIQKTQPAGTRPVRPSAAAAGIGSAKAGTPGGPAPAVNVMAIGASLRWRAALSPLASSRHFAVMSGSLPGIRREQVVCVPKVA